MGAFEGLFPMSFFKTQLIQYCIFALCFLLMHCKQTWHKDCLHCVISQRMLFSYVFCVKVTLTDDINSSNISLLRTVVLECTDHQPAEEHDASTYLVLAFAVIYGQYVSQP